MRNVRHISSGNLLRVASLLAWLVSLGWLLGGQRFQIFISPDLGWLLAGGCLLLIPMCIAAYFRLSAPSTDACQDWNRCGQTTLVLLPLVYLIAGVSFGGLGGQAFAQRYVAGQRSATPTADRQIDLSNPNINVLDLLDHVDELVGREVEVVGRVYHPAELSGQEFVLYRFLIVCCAADAVPIGVHVNWTGSSPPDDAWVRVHGEVSLIDMDGAPGALLTASSVAPTDPPKHPYLVP